MIGMKAEFKRKGGGKVKLVVGMTRATGAIFGVRLFLYNENKGGVRNGTCGDLSLGRL